MRKKMRVMMDDSSQDEIRTWGGSLFAHIHLSIESATLGTDILHVVKRTKAIVENDPTYLMRRKKLETNQSYSRDCIVDAKINHIVNIILIMYMLLHTPNTCSAMFLISIRFHVSCHLFKTCIMYVFSNADLYRIL